MTEADLRKALEVGLTIAVDELVNPPTMRRVIEATGTWAVSICHHGAELAPPQYLLDAWKAVDDELVRLRTQLQNRPTPKATTKEYYAWREHHPHAGVLAGFHAGWHAALRK